MSIGRSNGMRTSRYELGICRRHATQGRGVHLVAVIRPEQAEGGPAQRQRLVEHRVEYRRELARRGIDHLQHFGGCRLLLQGLARLGNEPSVFDRDHCLRGEVLQQRDLFVREWPDRLTVDLDDAK
jgi:hypothetical protein